MRRFLVLLTLVAVAVGLAPAAAPAAEAEGVTARSDGAAVLSPLGFDLLNRPDPVRGSDGRVHLVYELMVVNQAALPVTLDSVAVQTTGGRTLQTLDGDGLARMLRLNDGGTGTTIQAGGSALLFLDVTIAAGGRAPRRLQHRVTLTANDPISFTGVPVPVGRGEAVVVDAPLRGTGWVVGNGCCAPPKAHRSASLSIDGTVHVAERYAIDFVQLGPNQAIAQGDRTANAGFGYFGASVSSVAPGRVVNVRDGEPEQTPGALPPGQTVQTAGGNYVVVDIGDGRYAFYAHLQPGSLTVEVGDRVRRGQVLGLLGNTGNSDAPHLHFHVMDGPSPLRSNGLPFVFRSFRMQGTVTDEPTLLAGQPVTIDPAGAGRHRRELPLDLAVVDFAG
jgi:hypothetical protein